MNVDLTSASECRTVSCSRSKSLAETFPGWKKFSCRFCSVPPQLGETPDTPALCELRFPTLSLGETQGSAVDSR
jgi:hypothetical protein